MKKGQRDAWGRSTCLAAASLILETENRRKVMKGKEGGGTTVAANPRGKIK